MCDKNQTAEKRLKKLDLTRELLFKAKHEADRLRAFGVDRDAISEADLTVELYSELLEKLEGDGSITGGTKNDKPKRVNDDPEGYEPVFDVVGEINCEACDARFKDACSGPTHVAPCRSCDRPEGRGVHYVKTEEGASREK